MATKRKAVQKSAAKKRSKLKTHNRNCEIMAFGVCTCDWWEQQEKKSELGIS